MATLNLYATLLFNPLSYERYLAPLIAENEALQSQEDAVSELTTKANIWEGMADKERDLKTYAQYKKYADDLRTLAGNIANGLYKGSRADILNLRNRYSSEITPIENAYTTRKELIKAQLDALLKDPTHMFGVNAANVSLDEYLNNPAYDALQTNYSGALLTLLTSLAAAHLAKELRNYGKGKSIDSFTNTFIQNHGYKKEDVDAVASALSNPNSPAHQTLLGLIANQVMDASGIRGWNNKNALDKAWGYIGLGLYSAVGESQVNPIENKAAVLAAQYRNEINAAREKYKIEHPDNPTADEGLNSYISVPELDAQKSNKSERDKARKFISDWRKDKTGHFLENNIMVVNEVTGDPVGVHNNKDYWEELVQKYGTKSPAIILKKLDQEQRNEVQMYQRYRPNTAGYNNIIGMIDDNLRHNVSSSKTTGIREIDDGKIKSRNVSYTTLKTAMTNGATPWYSPRLKSWVISTVDKDNNVKDFAIAPEFINSSVRSDTGSLLMQDVIDKIDNQLKLGTTEGAKEANSLIDYMMKSLIITPSNSRILRQGETTTEDDVMSAQLGYNWQ